MAETEDVLAFIFALYIFTFLRKAWMSRTSAYCVFAEYLLLVY